MPNAIHSRATREEIDQLVDSLLKSAGQEDVVKSALQRVAESQSAKSALPKRPVERPADVEDFWDNFPV